jgi:hypothetical protein
MRALSIVALILTCAAALPITSEAQTVREDMIWARTSPAPITLDGVLDEAAWSAAESFDIRFGHDSGIPGSGWKIESGAFFPNDSTHATLKFLVHDNQLYLGAVVNDASVGGSKDFNRFDGLLMALKDRANGTVGSKPPSEYFYAWWYPESVDPQPAGQSPTFIGRWSEFPPGSPRTPDQIAAWDAVTVVDGLSNDDSVIDTGYTVEMRFSLTEMGYDVTQPGGDIIEWNLGIYDCDWFWPFAPATFGANRVWWQSPWGNAAWYNEVRIYARPDVTTTSSLPHVGADFIVPEIAATPTIDGQLSEGVWANPLVYEFDIRFDDLGLRDGYPAVGPYRAGQYQPDVNGGADFVADPADATVKMFFQDETLYLGFDVRDEVVQFHPSFDRWDGFLVTMNHRVDLGPDNNLDGKRLSFQVNADGTALAQDYLLSLVQAGDAEVAVALNPGTTVDTLGVDTDSGYTAEMAIDLTAMGYPVGLGDGYLFLGVNHLDGDSYFISGDAYGTRTWWFREYENDCCAAWGYLAPVEATGVETIAAVADGGFAQALPNPSRDPRIRFSVPQRSRVALEVFDIAGRRVEARSLGILDAGMREVPLQLRNPSAGVYLYRLKMIDPSHGSLTSTLQGKVTVLR